MSKFVIAALAAIAFVPQDEEKPVDHWTGSMLPSRVDAFPKAETHKDVHFGLIRDAKTWEALWKRLAKKAPRIDFKKQIAGFVYYRRWPGTLRTARPVIEKKCVMMEFAIDGGKFHREQKKDGDGANLGPIEISLPRCHYEWSVRVFATEGIDRVCFEMGGDVLCKVALKKKR